MPTYIRCFGNFRKKENNCFFVIYTYIYMYTYIYKYHNSYLVIFVICVKFVILGFLYSCIYKPSRHQGLVQRSTSKSQASDPRVWISTPQRNTSVFKKFASSAMGSDVSFVRAAWATGFKFSHVAGHTF